jgi:ATP-dependent RNA helicase RhlE
MSFDNFHLDARIIKGLQTAGFAQATPIQAAAIPAILAGRDIIGTAQTGTGKTAAFVLPILQHLLTRAGKPGAVRVLVVAPTRELAEQVHKVFKELGRFTALRAAAVYGGVGMGLQHDAFRKSVEVIVACPGRLLDHVARGNAKLDQVEILVLDEADRLLDMGFWPDVRKILMLVPAQRQTMMFSATFDSRLERLVLHHMRDPQRLSVDIEAPASTVTHALYPVSQKLKTDMLLRVLQAIDTRSVLIFTRTKIRADHVARNLARAGYQAGALHANKSQPERQQILSQFRAGDIPILVATDIAARGLDIETISHVINYDMPDSATTYIHRIGRTGRAERTGDAITLATWEDTDIIRDVERILGAPIPRQVLADFPYDEPLPETAEPAPPRTMSQRNTSTMRRRLS